MVLVVDDDRDLAESLCKVVVRAGFACDTALSARSGLAKLRENPDIQVIILDMRMDDKMLPDGYGEYTGMYFLDNYRGINPQARVIVLTGYPAVETAVPALSGGPDALALAYLEKPIDNTALVSKIKLMLRSVQMAEFRIDLTNDVAYCGDVPLEITNRQYQLFKLFMMSPPRWIDYEEIARLIDGETLDRAAAHKKWRTHMMTLRAALKKAAGRDVLVSVQQRGHMQKRNP